MRIAILADIHGNTLALDAVLADSVRRGVDGYWILGDFCYSGCDPVGVVERIAALPNAILIRGNTDRYVMTGEYPPPTIEQATADPKLLPTLVEVVSSVGWTRGALEARGWFDWLSTLRPDVRLTLPDGTPVLLTHASPHRDDGSGLHPALTDEECVTQLRECSEKLVCVGHFHMAMDRRLNGTRIINPGAISNTFLPDRRPAYAILTADGHGHTITFHRVEYDRAAAIEQARKSSNPGAPFILTFLEGTRRARWMERWDGQRHYPPLTP